jgi:N-acetylglutamate synthase-like GNAT family acetyltransferase
MAIRYASHADALAALELLLGGPYQDSERWLVADALFQDRLHAPDTPIIVAERDGSIAGVAILSLHQTLSGWYATLDELVVAPGWRQHGIGAALIAATVQIARGRGCAALHIIAPYDEQARAFLAACGFGAGEGYSLQLDR